MQVDSLPADAQGRPKNTGVGSRSLLQRIFPTQESNQGLLHCRQILYQLNYQEILVLGYSLKNNRMISVCLQGKQFNITIIQFYALTTNAKEAEVEQFCEDLQDLLESTSKRCSFHYRGLECKRRKSRDTWSNRQVWPWSTK